MNETYFKALLQELIDENPFSVRAVLKILGVEFTDSVPTLAVTREKSPRLLVNLAFLEEHCQTEKQVKAVIVHEFLHILLGHTEDKKAMTPARHLAFDAVINAIIHRQYGWEYSQMMSSYYEKALGLKILLRPMNRYEADRYRNWIRPQSELYRLCTLWDALYQGNLIADDIESLAQEMAQRKPDRVLADGPILISGGNPEDIGDLLGNHQDMSDALPEKLQEALDQALKEMNGSGIWREPWSRGVGARPEEALFRSDNRPLRRWQEKTLAVLREYVEPDRKSRARREEAHEYRIPVLSPGDRRAFLRSQWSPFLPDAGWSTTVMKQAGTTQVYLDVSGSMDQEMPLIIALLGRLSSHIRRPFWAFSDVVAPAVIQGGLLKTTSTGGTSMSCVLEHVVETRPASAVVVTDGYIEEVELDLLRKASATRIHAIVTRDGSPSALRWAGISYTQLDEVPS